MTQSIKSVFVLSLALVACGDANTDAAGSGSAKASAAKASATTTGASTGGATSKPATAAPTATATAAPVEMIEHDLSAGDAKWKGWTAKGPSDAKVMADGTNGARIAGKGPTLMDRKPGGDEGFDIAFAWGKQDLKETAKNVQKGATDAKSTFVMIKEEPGRLEYSIEGAASKTYYFHIHMNVDKKDVTCKNGNMMGAGNEAEHKRFMDACATLAKK